MRTGPAGALDRHRRWRAPQQGADAQHQFARFEGFAQIVVRPGLEAGDAILRGAAGGQQQDRQVLGLCQPQRLRQFEAAFARHHHVQHHQIGVDRPQLGSAPRRHRRRR